MSLPNVAAALISLWIDASRRDADGGESEHVELEPRKVFYLKRVGERTRVLELELLLQHVLDTFQTAQNKSIKTCTNT